MIKLILTPQRSDTPVSYSAYGNVLTVISGAAADSFDFSQLIDGDIAADFVSTLPVCPILSAECRSSDSEMIITVRAISWYGADADDEAKQIREVIL